MIATCDDWGAAKPDLRPAKEAGLRTALIRRWPWGYIQERYPDLPGAAAWRMTTLADLPPIVAAVNADITLIAALQSSNRNVRRAAEISQATMRNCCARASLGPCRAPDGMAWRQQLQ